MAVTFRTLKACTLAESLSHHPLTNYQEAMHMTDDVRDYYMYMIGSGMNIS
jgi:hypothetical protein